MSVDGYKDHIGFDRALSDAHDVCTLTLRTVKNVEVAIIGASGEHLGTLTYQDAIPRAYTFHVKVPGALQAQRILDFMLSLPDEASIAAEVSDETDT